MTAAKDAVHESAIESFGHLLKLMQGYLLAPIHVPKLANALLGARDAMPDNPALHHVAAVAEAAVALLEHHTPETLQAYDEAMRFAMIAMYTDSEPLRDDQEFPSPPVTKR